MGYLVLLGSQHKLKTKSFKLLVINVTYIHYGDRRAIEM